MGSAGVLLVDIDRAVAHVTLNRPERRNALSSELQTALVSALDQLAVNEEINAVLLAGSGPSFCAGHDLTETDGSNMDPLRFFDLAHRFYGAIWRFPKPIIVAAQGFVGPAGIELLLLSDIVVAGASTVCSYEMYRAGGVTPAFQLPWVVGVRRAKEILLTAPRLSAKEAESYGIVTTVVPDDDVHNRARAAAELVAAMPPLHTRLSKLLVNQATEAMGAGPLAAFATSVEALARLSLTETLESAKRDGLAAVLADQETRFRGLVDAWRPSDDGDAS